jgi:flagellar hook assembly protein FlgD
MAEAGFLRAQIFDISGRLVRTLQNSAVGPGYHDVAFDGLTSEGRRLPSGLYFYRVETPGSVMRGEFVLLR